MPEERILRVFVSSPSDVIEEREAVYEAIDEINTTLADAYATTFRVIDWEKDIPPGVGEEPQSVIMQAIIGNYEVYLGILGKRFGTPTLGAGSGTEAEFREALERKAEDPDSIKILFYCKDTISKVSQTDSEQLQRVLSFREVLSNSGAMYQPFHDTDELAKFVRLHLPKIARDWGDGDSLGGPSQPESPTPTPDEEGEDELGPGVLDLLDMGLDQGDEVIETAKRITHATTEVGQRLSSRAEAIKSVGSIETRKQLKQIRAIVGQTVNDLRRFSDRLESETPLFASAYEDYIDVQIELFNLASGVIEPEQREEYVGTVETLLESITSSRESVAVLRAAFSTWPHIDKTLTRGKQEAMGALNDFEEEIDRAVRITEELIRVASEE